MGGNKPNYAPTIPDEPADTTPEMTKKEPKKPERTEDWMVPLPLRSTLPPENPPEQPPEQPKFPPNDARFGSGAYAGGLEQQAPQQGGWAPAPSGQVPVQGGGQLGGPAQPGYGQTQQMENGPPPPQMQVGPPPPGYGPPQPQAQPQFPPMGYTPQQAPMQGGPPPPGYGQPPPQQISLPPQQVPGQTAQPVYEPPQAQPLNYAPQHAPVQGYGSPPIYAQPPPSQGHPSQQGGYPQGPVPDFWPLPARQYAPPSQQFHGHHNSAGPARRERSPKLDMYSLCFPEAADAHPRASIPEERARISEARGRDPEHRSHHSKHRSRHPDQRERYIDIHTYHDDGRSPPRERHYRHHSPSRSHHSRARSPPRSLHLRDLGPPRKVLYDFLPFPFESPRDAGPTPPADNTGIDPIFMQWYSFVMHADPKRMDRQAYHDLLALEKPLIAYLKEIGNKRAARYANALLDRFDVWVDEDAKAKPKRT